MEQQWWLPGVFGRRVRRAARLAALPALIAALAAPVAPVAPAAAAAGSYIPAPGFSTTTFASCPPFEGAPCAYQYTVPSGVYGIHVVLVGGKGATGLQGIADNPGSGGAGGQGAQVIADVPVQAGEALNVNVGTDGTDPTQSEIESLPAWLGGGVGGIETFGAVYDGGEGGGASVIDNCFGCGVYEFDNHPPASSVLAVAGGGGGGGGGGTAKNGGSGGTAGFDLNGNHKNTNGGDGVGKGGGGATLTGGGAGGSGGNGESSGLAGGFLTGGLGGAQGGYNHVFAGGGGGGGGWYGGGGGGEGGGENNDGGGGGGGAGSSAVMQGSTVESIAPTSNSPMVSITPAIVPPAAPTGVNAVAGVQQATVSFTPTSMTGGAPVEYYTVYAHPGDTSGARTTTTSSPIVVTNLNPGTQYTFTVTATNRAGEGPVSAPSTAVVPYALPGPPKITSTTAGNGQAKIAFTPSQADQNSGNPITSYTVTARAGVGVTSGPGITASGTTSPITLTGLTNGTNYTVTVYASNAAGNGPESAPRVVFPATVPGAPTNVTATNATGAGAATGTVNLTIAPPASDGGRPVLNYTAVSSPGGIIATGSGPNIQVTGLTIGTSYTFTAYATNALGNGPASAPSNAVTPVLVPSPPQVPGAAPLDKAAYVSCLPPTSNGGSPIVSYTVTSSPGGINATGSSCPILVTGLTDGTKYTFTVTATNAAGGTSQPSQPTSKVIPRVPAGRQPANDNFASAQVISGTSGSVSGTNVGATVEPNEPTIQDVRGGASVWFKWVVPATGTYQFDTCTATPAVVGLIGAFTGNSVGSLTEFGPGPSPDSCPTAADGSGEAGSSLTISPIAGQTIYIKFDGVNPGSNANPPYEGPFTLEWNMQ
ncbi:MAG: fibronectin type III domain-containing protein [Chloroflexi bacterium]|nr:fibronectin type III domain-containing protein [Chloroflexota bacterium]